MNNYSLQTAAAFERLEDALKGKTEDDLHELIRDLEYLLYRAKEIQDISASMIDGSDYEPVSYCDVPVRNWCASCRTGRYIYRNAQIHGML